MSFKTASSERATRGSTSKQIFWCTLLSASNPSISWRPTTRHSRFDKTLRTSSSLVKGWSLVNHTRLTWRFGFKSAALQAWMPYKTRCSFKACNDCGLFSAEKFLWLALRPPWGGLLLFGFLFLMHLLYRNYWRCQKRKTFINEYFFLQLYQHRRMNSSTHR